MAIEKSIEYCRFTKCMNIRPQSTIPNWGALFVDYINTFLKLKAEASGYPAWIPSPQEEDRYIATFFETEGVRLDRATIKPNSPKRDIAKLCLNSICGKLTELNNRSRTKMISDPHEFYRFLATPGIEVTNLLFASVAVFWSSWRYTDEENIPILRHTNEVIGAFVTACAHLHLYSCLDRLQEKPLYCNTDSVFYVQRENEPALIPCGDKLGDMVSELQPGEHVTEFVSAGVKNYAYKIANSARGETKTVCKVRGIAVNYSASHLVNFAVIKKMILEPKTPPDTVTVHTEKKIKRKRDRNGGPIHIHIYIYIHSPRTRYIGSAIPSGAN
jgi:hypothetical protein